MHRSIKNFVLISSAFVLLLPKIVWGVTASQAGGWFANIVTGGGYYAATEALNAVGEGAVDKAVQGLGVILNSLSMAALQLGGFFAEAALALSLDIVNSPTVQTGFKIALTLANLGFVIAIVVIALATIFRNQTYGIKRALVRLVVMAILVNFSLILTGVALNFSDRLTIYFLDYISPDLGDGWKFSLSLMKGLQGQAFQVGPGEISDTGVTDTAVREIIALFTTIIFTSLVALAIWVLAITLFVRYIWLTLLLIVMPMAWLSWIFPATSRWWKQWWDKFIQWTFYAPAMMFFVYLALTLANTDFVRESMTAQGQTAESLGMWSAGTVQAAVKSTIIVFLLFGGFIAAKSMGVGMAGSASDLAQSTSKKIWGATKRGAARGGIRAGTAAFRRKNEEGKSVAERTRTWAQGIQNPAGRIAAGWLARGATKLETVGGEKLLKDYEKDVSKMSGTEAQAALLTTVGGPRRVALIKKLIKDKKLSGVPMDLVLNESNKKLMANFGQGSEFNNMEKQFMMSQGMYQAIKDNKPDEMRKERTKFFKSLSKGDVANMQFNDIFSGKDKLGLSKEDLEKYAQEIAIGLVSDAPQLVPNIIPKMKGEAGERFKKIYEDAAQNEIARLEKEVGNLGSLDEQSQENMRKIKSIEKALDNFESKIWANNAVFGGGEDREEKAEKKEEAKEPATTKT